MSSFSQFGETAGRLSRNPLGIIALFIVLLYGIAGLVLGTTADNFDPSERSPLVWFLVVFPVIVLAVFGWLVSRHHEKLYAPGDYKSDDAFLKTLSPEAQRRRLDKEVEELEAAESAGQSAPETNAAEGTSSSPPQSPQSTGGGFEIGNGVRRYSMNQQYRTEALLAEDLVLRQLESELGTPIRRQAAITQGNRQIQLDGLFVINGRATGIEVKIFRQKFLRNNLNNRIAEIAAKGAELASMSGAEMVVAVVGVGLTEESRKLIAKRFSDVAAGVNIPMHLRFFDFGELQELYGIAQNA